MRRMILDGVCRCCGREGAVWHSTYSAPGFIDTPGVAPMECDSLPDLCDRCNDAQRRWDDWQAAPDSALYWNAHTEGPPKTPPVGRADR